MLCLCLPGFETDQGTSCNEETYSELLHIIIQSRQLWCGHFYKDFLSSLQITLNELTATMCQMASVQALGIDELPSDFSYPRVLLSCAFGINTLIKGLTGIQKLRETLTLTYQPR